MYCPYLYSVTFPPTKRRSGRLELAIYALQWRHNGRDGVSNHQPHDCLLCGLFGRRSKKTSKFRVAGLCARTSPVTGEFPAQRTSNAENGSIWWRHHGNHRSVPIPVNKFCVEWIKSARICWKLATFKKRNNVNCVDVRRIYFSCLIWMIVHAATIDLSSEFVLGQPLCEKLFTRINTWLED